MVLTWVELIVGFVGCRLSVVGCWLSVVGCRLSVVGERRKSSPACRTNEELRTTHDDSNTITTKNKLQDQPQAISPRRPLLVIRGCSLFLCEEKAKKNKRRKVHA